MAIMIDYENFGAVEATEGDLLLDALMLAGAPVPYSCQQGNCGTCKCELVAPLNAAQEGTILELEYSEYALPPELRAKNILLACRTQVWGDIKVRRVDEEDLMMHPSRILRCTVAKLEALTHDITGVTLQIGVGGPFTFSAGQYASVEFLPDIARDYSMANTPAVSARDGRIEFQIRAAGGQVSQHIALGLKVGDSVKVRGPLGTSYLREKYTGPMLCIAGGSGLAPIESIVHDALQGGFAHPIYLYIGARSPADLYHLAELRALSEKHPKFSIEVVLVEGGSAANGTRSGHVTKAVSDDFPDARGMKAYVAGPPVMVEAATHLLQSRGMKSRDIHADAFYTHANKNK